MRLFKYFQLLEHSQYTKYSVLGTAFVKISRACFHAKFFFDYIFLHIQFDPFSYIKKSKTHIIRSLVVNQIVVNQIVG
jgi:hypothetical protein